MINVFSPKVTIHDFLSVNKALLKSEISGTSPIIQDFESKFAKYNSKTYGVAVSNGSVALDLAFQALNLSENDEVILPSFTIISCLSAVLRSGAKPVFCEVDESSWNMTLETVRGLVTDSTKAILVVHTYGLPSEINKIKKFALQKKIKIIEDSAEAHGLRNEGTLCGQLGDISTFSFYANKHVTTGEGGMLLTDSKSDYLKIKQMRNLDFKKDERFKHENLYWNYRMSGLQAALGISQLANLEKNIQKKIYQGNKYLELLDDYQEYLQLPLKKLGDDKNHFWVFGIVLKQKNIRDSLIQKLLREGIETRPFFYPLHLQPVLNKKFKPNYDLGITENLGNNGLYLPLGNHVTGAVQKKVINKLLANIKVLTS